MNHKCVSIENKCLIYIDNLVRKPFVGKFLRIFCLYLSYLQLNLYGVSTVYYAVELTGTQSLPYESRNVSYETIAMDGEYTVVHERFERWVNFMGLEFSLIGLLSVGAMLHGIKTLQRELMIPWIVFHMLFLYLNFLRENVQAIINIDYSTTTALLFVLKLVFFVIIVLTVCFYYRKIHLDHQGKQEAKKE